MGASEAYDVCLGDALAVWGKKTGRLEPQPPTLEMEIGLLAEPLVERLYERAGRDPLVYRQYFLRDPRRPFVTATLDGLSSGGRVVEFKLISPHRGPEIRELQGDELPDAWAMQVQQQMHVAQRDEADVAVLIGFHTFKVVRVQRSDLLIRRILEEEERFWECVTRDTQPPHRPSRDLEVVKALYPHCRGIGYLGDAEAALAGGYLALNEAIREMEAKRDEVKAALLCAMGECEVADLPDGRCLSRKVITVHHKATAERTSQHIRFTVKEASGDRG